MTWRTFFTSAAVFLMASFAAGYIGEAMGRAEYYRGAVFGMWAMWWLMWVRKA